MKLLAKNKRATFDYQLDERVVAGLALTGPEVKSIKANAHVTPYSLAAVKEYDPLRNRKLLLHRRQLDELIKQKQAGLSVIPTALLLEHNFIKLEVGIGKG